MVARLPAFLAVVLAVAGCAAPGDVIDKWFGSGPAQKPADLVVFKPTATARIVWQGNVGPGEKHVFTPAIHDGSVLAAGAAGQIARFDAATGKQLGRIDTKTPLSGGIGTNGAVILAGTVKGEVLALDNSGKPLWKTQLTSEVLSAPKVDQGVVVVRSGDGRIFGLDAATGPKPMH